jgi:hypothetical protein
VDNFDASGNSTKAGYRRPLLVRYTYEYSRSDLSRDIFLRAFFDPLDLDITSDQDINFDDDDDDLEDQLGEKLTSFADFLLDNFFLPRQISSLPLTVVVGAPLTFNIFTIKASGHQTPQPSPALLSASAIRKAQGGARGRCRPRRRREPTPGTVI